MTWKLDRRALLVTAGFGIGGLLLPAGAFASEILSSLTGFTHNVASGEPGSESMLLWTRFVPADGGAAKLRAELSVDPEFSVIAAGGQMVTGPWRDHTAKITVDGLTPDTRYYYRFIAPDGSFSPVGRTKTLPVGKVDRFNIAVFSCSNLGFGYFNAYGHAAARDDLDMTLHMGDYLYEYAPGGYDAGPAFSKRIDPKSEIISLADYRLRYASYRADPDLQALHAAAPMIVIQDDHESTNDSWEGGAQNHQDNEGDWSVRRNAAMQAWREWMPIGEQPWQAYAIGDLATYFRTDTRTIARSRPPELGPALSSAEREKALAEFRDGEWMNDSATMLGSEQESWLYRSFARNKAVWTMVGVGTNMGYGYTPENATDWLAKDADPRALSYVKSGIAAAKAGLPFNMDNWGGYPKARSRFLSAAQRAGSNLIVITGDSHNGWAFDLPEGGKAAGVEFGGHSVSSPGFEQATGKTDPKIVARDMIAASPNELRWMDSSNRGYMMLSLTPQDATNEWVFMQTVRTKSLAVKAGHKMRVRAGYNRLDV
ncbi:alkaline phosphatase D family protein [Sphingorhabdus arenilitoris]|uniref:Alkaline phosphatase D family protein n=1 Tax=Sphingorhabdus arenilitoris TaxID=1490041 RepID=A0ABV8RGN4_9SPHN